MNEKNERDIFKDLIDSIQVDEEPAAPKSEPVQVPICQNEPAEPPRAARAESVAPQQEELPRWLTEKKGRPATNQYAQAAEKAAKAKAAQNGQTEAASPRPAEKKPTMAEQFRVNLSQQDYEKPAMTAEERQAQQEKAQAQKAAAKPVKKKKKIRKKYRVGRALLMTILCVVLSVYLAKFFLSSFEDLTGVVLFGDQSQREVQMQVEIPEGASMQEITEILADSGAVTEPLAFRAYVWLKKEEGFLPGSYQLTGKMDYNDIIYALQAGDQRTDVVDIMFPEGATSLDIANKLQENGVCDADEFLAALNRRDYNYTFVENIPENELRFYDLEGYLFPNTHQFFVGESVDSVLNRFLKDFSSQITDEMRTRMNELNLTLDETLILASIIQKEASDPDEMKNISEVFHNRLRNSDTYPNLQSDPTIFYVERVIKQKIGMTNQPMYDAYNTYVCKGLPVAPICNPGIDAIEAALYPANHDVDYFYFVTDDEGKYYYAATLAEHNYNIAMADQVNARVEKEKEEAAKAEAAASSTAQ